jgi:hypothetical protein
MLQRAADVLRAHLCMQFVCYRALLIASGGPHKRVAVSHTSQAFTLTNNLCLPSANI